MEIKKGTQSNILIWLFMLVLLILGVQGCQSLDAFSPPQVSAIYDCEGRPIQGLHQQNRVDVCLRSVSPYMIKAVMAAEDQHFYEHHGIDVKGIARAALHNLSAGRIREGGSTITQQTAKNLYLTQERTWNRKLKELYYTLALERHYTKNEIMEMYLNTIYFGEGAYGVEAASRVYFNKGSSKLSLGEAALLAGIVRRPSYYDPYHNPTAAKGRRDYVLSRMAELRYITWSEAVKEKEKPIRLARGKYPTGDAPYFVDMVSSFLRERYGERMVYQGGLKVYTTLDLDLQRAAQAAFDRGLSGQPSDLQGALVAVEPGSGRVLALIGGRDYRKYPFNRAVNSKRSPGSAFKPFLYSRALEDGYTEASMLVCEPVEFRQEDGTVYRPTDYGDIPYHNRAMTLKEAIMISDNVVAVRLIEKVGPERVAQYAKRFGFASRLGPYYSLALGGCEVSPLELADAYAVFASGGVYCQPYFIEKIENAKGEVIYQNQSRREQILRPVYAYLVSDLLTAVFEPGGTASHLRDRLGFTASGKTGTSQKSRDAWFAGYTPKLSCAVWVGYDEQARSVNIAGGRIAGPIWADFMREAAKKVTAPEFEVPPEIIKCKVCLDSGDLATEYCERVLDMAFIKGTEPQKPCFIHTPEGWELLPGVKESERKRSEPRLKRWFHRFLGL